jgi:hypothetical protein
MATGFQYFIPGRQAVTRADVDGVGLAYAFDQAVPGEPVQCGTTRGPAIDGVELAGGVAFADRRSVPPGRVGVYAGQSWRPVPGSPAYVGWFDDDRPTAEAVKRSAVLAGSLVRLADGGEWLVPVARRVHEMDDAGGLVVECALPATVAADADGNWTPTGIIERYAPLWSYACDYWDSCLIGAAAGEDTGAYQFEFNQLFDAALFALQCNYRVGKAEASALGLFTHENAVAVMAVVTDFDAALALVKKKIEALPHDADNGPPGEPA